MFDLQIQNTHFQFFYSEWICSGQNERKRKIRNKKRKKSGIHSYQIEN